MDPLTILVLVVVVLLLLGYGGYARSRFASPTIADVLVILCVIVLLAWLFGWHPHR